MLNLVDLHVRQLFLTFHGVKRFRMLLKVDFTSMYVTVVFYGSPKLETYQYVQLYLQLYYIESNVQANFSKTFKFEKT